MTNCTDASILCTLGVFVAFSVAILQDLAQEDKVPVQQNSYWPDCVSTLSTPDGSESFKKCVQLF